MGILKLYSVVKETKNPKNFRLWGLKLVRKISAEILQSYPLRVDHIINSIIYALVH